MIKKLKQQLQVEVDTAFLYKALATKHQNQASSKVFEKMSEIEQRHAQKVLQKIRALKPEVRMPNPSFRAKLQVKLAQYLGFDFILSHLMALEYQISKSTVEKKVISGEKINGLEHVHLNIIRNLTQQDTFAVGGGGGLLSKFEGKHKTIGGNELRAAVLGSIDGLVSNLSLVMGIIGASSANQQVLIAGCAGLLAGAISMAMGEWLSVQSTRELYQRQIDIEAEELENSPEEEMNELIILYEAKGMSPEDAKRIAEQVFSNKETALDALVREELGIDKESLGGSAIAAAITSFCLFSIGAIIPVSPFFFLKEDMAILVSILFSACCLFLFGACITLLTGRSVLYSGTRQVLFGLGAAGITYLIGKMIGITLMG